MVFDHPVSQKITPLAYSSRGYSTPRFDQQGRYSSDPHRTCGSQCKLPGAARSGSLYNGKYYSVRINKVLSYPQAFAAAVTQYSTLKAHSVAYIIDIGGFTIDVLKLRFGRPDLEVVESFEKGVITLYNSIASKCNSQYARILEECEIDEVIRNQPTVLPGEVQQLIRSMTADFLAEFYNFLRERGIDVSTSKCVFAGGGSLLLRGMIERGNKVAFPIFIEDIHANAIGYEVLYQSEVAANGKQ